VATTSTHAPASSNPAILPSATLPAPTTRHRRPSSFRKIGNIVFVSSLRPSAKKQKPTARCTGDGLGFSVPVLLKFSGQQLSRASRYTRTTTGTTLAPHLTGKTHFVSRMVETRPPRVNIT